MKNLNTETLNLEPYAKHLSARHLTPQTVLHTLRHLRAFMTWRGADDWRDVTLEEILHWHDAMSRQGLAAGTRCTKVWAVKAFMAWLHQRRLILVNPAAHLPPLRKPKPLPRGVLTPSQLNTLILAPSAATPEGLRDRALFELLYSSGLRAGELCKLTLYDLDAVKRLATIKQAKGRKDRLVPVGHVALEWLALYLKDARPAFAARAKPGISGTRLFLTRQGAQLTPQRLLVIVRRHARQAGLPNTVTPHSLRHACAIGMLRGGASIRHVQEMLGHSTLITTQIYTRLIKDDLKAVHARTSPSERRTNTEAPPFTFTNWRPRKAKKPRKPRTTKVQTKPTSP